MKKHTLFFGFLFFVFSQTFAQILNPKETAKRKAEQRTNSRIDRTIDKVFDKAESGVEGVFKKKDKKNKDNSNSQQGNNQNSSSNSSSGSSDNSSGSTSSGDLKISSKFDFVSGEKVIAQEDFSQDAIGDFPAKWNTNGTGEVVNLGSDNTTRWLKVGKETVLYPEFINQLPENFTFEFDLACTNNFSFYSGFLYVNFANVAAKNKSFMNDWRYYSSNAGNGVRVGLHPQSAGGQKGRSFFVNFDDNKEIIKNEQEINSFHFKNSPKVHIAVWRQKGRIRVYVNQEKIWDIPRAFDTEKQYNRILFTTGGYHNSDDSYFISNLKLAVGAPDTRNKLLTEGKFVTNGITFDVNSDKIKPSSYGVIREIGLILSENPQLKIKIIGHTDSDGTAENNLKLSQKRALAVKNALVKEFGISEKNIETDGKGSSEPIDSNATPQGKANNRRVEFIKL
jgi:outer membrane protein OmpA-like peptidoglycan-associated protein